MLACVRARPGQRLGARRALRRRALAIGALMSAAAGLTVAAAFAAPSKTVTLADPKGDVTGALDLQRASLNLASDGRLRAVITLAGKLDPEAMLADTGPPGSICVKVWTATDADPTATRADRLVCVTAKSKDELRASVLSQTAAGLPVSTGTAAVKVNESKRSIVVRISQSSLGRPELIRFAFESTRPGCERVSCIDQSPDKGAVRRFRVR
jgi:hypothetical protein